MQSSFGHLVVKKATLKRKEWSNTRYRSLGKSKRIYQKKFESKDECVPYICKVLQRRECNNCIVKYKEIETLKKKINTLEKAAISDKEQHRDLVEKVKEFEVAFTEINAYSRTNAKNMHEFVQAIKKLLKKPKEKQQLSDDDDTINDLNKQVSLRDSEIEELKNVVKKLENDISTMASDMKRKLKLKDDEADILKEELDRCKVQSAKDGNIILEKDETIADLRANVGTLHYYERYSMANRRKRKNSCDTDDMTQVEPDIKTTIKEKNLKDRNDDLESRCGQSDNQDILKIRRYDSNVDESTPFTIEYHKDLKSFAENINSNDKKTTLSNWKKYESLITECFISFVNVMSNQRTRINLDCTMTCLSIVCDLTDSHKDVIKIIIDHPTIMTSLNTMFTTLMETIKPWSVEEQFIENILFIFWNISKSGLPFRVKEPSKIEQCFKHLLLNKQIKIAAALCLSCCDDTSLDTLHETKTFLDDVQSGDRCGFSEAEISIGQSNINNKVSK